MLKKMIMRTTTRKEDITGKKCGTPTQLCLLLVKIPMDDDVVVVVICEILI